MEDIIQQDLVYIDRNSKEHQIYPMLLGDIPKVQRLLSKVNTEFLALNLPEPKLNKAGKEIIDKKTKEVVLDYTKYNAMLELFGLALREPKEDIELWVDLQNGVHLIDEYLQLSGLKKKMEQRMMEVLSQYSSQP